MKYTTEAYSIQELGQRQNQEDSLFPACGSTSAEDRLFIICDGMGGHEKGEVASATVCKAISQTVLNQWHPDEPLGDELLLQAISAAYDALDAKDDNAEKKMGTTLALLCLHANGATVAHIGDSRVYQFRPGQGIVFRTQDHSFVNDLIKIGEITEEEAKHHPQKNVITRAMQPHQQHRAKADIAHLSDIRPGDYFFICSDGMLEHTSDENLVNIITEPGVSNTEKTDRLRSLTKENGDNHTAQLISIISVADGAARLPIPRRAIRAPFGTLIKVDFPVAKPKLNKKRLLIIGVVAAIALLALGCIGYKTIHFNDKPTPKQPTEQTTTHSTKKSRKAQKMNFKPVLKMEVQQMGSGAALYGLLRGLTNWAAKTDWWKRFFMWLDHSIGDIIPFLSIALYGASGVCGIIAIFQLFKYFELRSQTDE